jgi:hypothetical protein
MSSRLIRKNFTNLLATVEYNGEDVLTQILHIFPSKLKLVALMITPDNGLDLIDIRQIKSYQSRTKKANGREWKYGCWAKLRNGNREKKYRKIINLYIYRGEAYLRTVASDLFMTYHYKDIWIEYDRYCVQSRETWRGICGC